MAFIETLLLSWKTILESLAPIISILLIISGGILYGISFTQPSEKRGKLQGMGIGMIAGGIVIAAITGAAVLIRDTSSNLLKP